MPRSKKSADPAIPIPCAPAPEQPISSMQNVVDVVNDAGVVDQGLGAGLFTLDAIRLPQNYGGLAAVKKAFLQIPVRKPRPQSFVRVRPDDGPDVQTLLLTVKEDREDVYLVAPTLWTVLQAELTPHILAITIDRQNNVCVWPLRLPAVDGRANGWHTSALQAANVAKSRWIRCQANMVQGQYDVFEAAATNLSEPEWPMLSTEEILRIAFKDRYIATLDHPVLRKLRGEV
jgi:hypothetical protein